MRVIPLIIYMLLLSFHVVIFKDITSIWGATINLTALLVLLVSLYKDDISAGWFGFIIGLVSAAALPEQMAWYTLLAFILALVGCSVRERINLDSLKARLLVIFGCVLLYNIISLIISHRDSFFYLLASTALPGAIYTTIIAWLFFLYKEGKLSFKHLKEMF